MQKIFFSKKTHTLWVTRTLKFNEKAFHKRQNMYQLPSSPRVQRRVRRSWAEPINTPSSLWKITQCRMSHSNNERSGKKKKKKVLSTSPVHSVLRFLVWEALFAWKNAWATGGCGGHDVTAMHVRDLEPFSRAFVLQMKYNEAVPSAPRRLYIFVPIDDISPWTHICPPRREWTWANSQMWLIWKREAPHTRTHTNHNCTISEIFLKVAHFSSMHAKKSPS